MLFHGTYSFDLLNWRSVCVLIMSQEKEKLGSTTLAKVCAVLDERWHP